MFFDIFNYISCFVGYFDLKVWMEVFYGLKDLKKRRKKYKWEFWQRAESAHEVSVMSLQCVPSHDQENPACQVIPSISSRDSNQVCWVVPCVPSRHHAIHEEMQFFT